MSKLKAKHYLVAGSDEYLAKARAGAILKELEPEDPMNLEVVNGYVDSAGDASSQIAAAVEAIQTLPFFGGTKVIHFKDVNFMGDSQMGRSEEVKSSMEGFVEVLRTAPVESVRVVISASAVDKRRATFKALSGICEVEVHERMDLSKGKEMEVWLEEVERRLIEAGLKPAEMVVENLVEFAGNDSRSLHEEIEKLSLYTHPHGEVTVDHVRQICSGSREMVVFDLCDAITQGQAREAIRLLRKLLAQGESEVGLLMILGGQVRLSALGMHLMETGRLKLIKRGSFVNAQITEEGEELLPRDKKGNKPNPFRLSKAVHLASRRKSSRWFKALEIVHESQSQLFAPGVDKKHVLQTMVMELCSV